MTRYKYNAPCLLPVVDQLDVVGNDALQAGITSRDTRSQGTASQGVTLLATRPVRTGQHSPVAADHWVTSHLKNVTIKNQFY